MSKGQIYLEEFNIMVNNQKNVVDALIFENEDGKVMITDSASNEYVMKYAPTNDGVYYLTNLRKLYYLGTDGSHKEIKSNLPLITKDLFVSFYGDKALYAHGEIFAIGPDGITMELQSQYNNYEFVGSNNEELYFYDTKDKEFFKVTYDSSEKDVIYTDIEKVKIIDDKIIYVIKCDYPANNKIFIADLTNAKDVREVITIDDCERVIDFNFTNNLLVYSCEFFSSGDVIRLYSINVNKESEVEELHKWKKKYYFEEDRILLEEESIILFIQTELEKYEKWNIAYDGSKQKFVETVDEGLDVKQILKEAKEDLKNNSRKTNRIKAKREGTSGAESAGIIHGNVSNASTIYNYDKLATPRGHGFAAEQANHLVDKVLNADVLGSKVKLVGDDNAKDGADRMVNGTSIQTKYCSTGSKCISECFNNGEFRYFDSSGKPMKIEVPCDQNIYEGAVKAMEERIKNGQVPGVTDPKEAKNIVKKGHFTYAQARNIAKAGTVESIVYDSATGLVTATQTFGISTAIAFATAIWNGEDIEIALKSAVHTGLKVGGTTFVVGVLSSQLAKAGLNSVMVSGSEALVRAMGPKASALMANALRSGSNIYGAAAMKSAAKMLRGNAITAGVTVAVLSTVDVVNIFSGKISGKQLFKNLTNTAATVAAGTAGWTAGAAIGSVVPVVGTFIGGLVGSALAGAAASKATGAIMDNFIEDDADEMVEIIQNVFVDLCSEYLLSENEAEEITDILSRKITGSTLKEMFASSDRIAFARALIEADIEEITANRDKISLPSEEQLQKTMIEVLENIYDESEVTVEQ